ncbi:Rv3235 family protein [Parasphingorhabdus pacifica]
MSAGPDNPAELSSHALVTGIVTVLLEVLAGRKPLNHVRHRVTGPVALLLTTIPSQAEGPSYRLRSVHTCPTTTRTVEACAIVETSRRARALVVRLERRTSGWVCALLTEL